MITNNQVPVKPHTPSLIVVDDEEDILKSLRGLLRREKYKMHFFTSGLDALEFLKKNKVDVIISDMRMPEISGAELLHRSAGLNPNTINIILSGYEEKNVVFNALKLGLAKHYIMKPWDDEQLRQVIRDSMNFQIQLRKKHLEDVMHSFKSFPSPPKVHTRLVEILKSERQSQKEIAAEIEKSPELVSKLLRISNSVFYGSRQQMSSVYEALTFIGTESVLEIVLELESFGTLARNADKSMLHHIESIRQTSILRAHIAREISIRWPKKSEQHQNYVAALLLDIGLVLRICSSFEKFSNYYALNKHDDRPVYLIDKDLFSISHDNVGAALLTYWNFPVQIINTVANHHSYTGDDTMTTIIQLADAMAQKKDSSPHDPIIDGYLKEWEPEMEPFIKYVKETNNIFE